MKNITKRTFVSVILAFLLMIGAGYFTVEFVKSGNEWASFSANTHIYNNGVLKSGAIYDVNGVVLAQAKDGGWQYTDSKTVRTAMMHTIGLPGGQVATGTMTRFAGDLSGYNIITGTQHFTSTGRNIYLTLDSELCKVAYEALGQYKGTVGVYNYKTGDIICMVSTPSFDPANPPVINDGDPKYDGVYLNRFISSSFIPGSTFKLITLAAALEKIPGVENMTFQCDGKMKIGDKEIVCTGHHGEIGLERALNVSCNCAFGQLAVKLGGKALEEYVDKTGLTTSYSVSGISTRSSSFDFSSSDDGDIAWSGIGQGKDLVNPCSLMVYMGAIANGGQTAVPQIISKKTLAGGLKTSIILDDNTKRLIARSTAETISKYMKSNVVKTYGENRFGGLDIYAKTGTAEVDNNNVSNSWFAGYINNEDSPYAFVVFAEGGGSGIKTAASIATKVLSAATEK